MGGMTALQIIQVDGKCQSDIHGNARIQVFQQTVSPVRSFNVVTCVCIKDCSDLLMVSEQILKSLLVDLSTIYVQHLVISTE